MMFGKDDVNCRWQLCMNRQSCCSIYSNEICPFGDSDECILHQSRERWSASQNRLDTCPGEKAELQAHLSNVSTQHKSNMIAKGSASSVTGLAGHQEGWTECFQNLETWCPPPQDELNTPQVTADGFNFGTFDQVKVLDSWYPVDLMAESLGGDMANMTSAGFDLDEENNNNTSPYLKLPQTSSTIDGICSGKSLSSLTSYAKSPLKSTSANILLSQSALQDVAPFPKFEAEFKTEIDYKPFPSGALYDVVEDEENFVLVPPESVTRRSKDFRVPFKSNVFIEQKPKLKLNIVPPTVTSAVVMPSTPEVQKVLNEPKVGFDLIKYVVSSDDIPEEPVVEAAPDVNPFFQVSVVKDHDYIDTGLSLIPEVEEEEEEEEICIKDEPLSPNCVAAAVPSRTRTQRTERGRPVKRRSDSNSDYIFESDIGTSDESVDWEPLKSTATKGHRTKKPKIAKVTPKLESSDAESVANSTVSDKYRELRDKNNEASRRSRLNRKQRDTEMRKVADKLESQNRALRARADRMHKLVLDMREVIMRTIKAANKKT